MASEDGVAGETIFLKKMPLISRSFSNQAISESTGFGDNALPAATSKSPSLSKSSTIR